MGMNSDHGPREDGEHGPAVAALLERGLTLRAIGAIGNPSSSVTVSRIERSLGLSGYRPLQGMLRRCKIPGFRLLRPWLVVLRLLHKTTAQRCTPCSLALRHCCDPAHWYRLVKKTTGLPWSEVERCGIRWIEKAAMSALGLDSMPSQVDTYGQRATGNGQRAIFPAPPPPPPARW